MATYKDVKAEIMDYHYPMDNGPIRIAFWSICRELVCRSITADEAKKKFDK